MGLPQAQIVIWPTSLTGSTRDPVAGSWDPSVLRKMLNKDEKISKLYLYHMNKKSTCNLICLRVDRLILRFKVGSCEGSD